MAKACTCGQDCGFNRGDLVCCECGVPYEYARRPCWLQQTLMSDHNKIILTCYLCIEQIKAEARKTKHETF